MSDSRTNATTANTATSTANNATVGTIDLIAARDLLSVDQVAAHLQMSKSSVRSYIRQGKLKAFRIAGKRNLLIPRDAMLALLEPARETPQTDETGDETGDEAA